MSRQQRRAEERRSSKQKRKATLAAFAAMAATSALIATPADAAGNGKHVHGALAHWARQPGAVKARPAKGKHKGKKTAAASKTKLRPQAFAASIIVNSLADTTTPGDAQCTLREALANANTDSDTTGGDCAAGQDAADVITFSVTGSIVTGSRLDVLDGVTINGPGEASLTVSGNNDHRVFYLYAQNENVTISNLTVSGGFNSQNEPGGGIASFGTNLTLDHATLSGNTTNASAGGGLFAVGGNQSLTIQSSTLSGNTAGIGGGAYVSLYGSINITDSTVTNNNAAYGGGLAFYSYAIPSLQNLTISSNHASAVGGGMVAQLYGITMDNVTITGNTSDLGGGGAVINHATGAHIEDSRVTNNTAIDVGGLFIQKTAFEGGGGAGKKSRSVRVRPHGVLLPTFDGAEIIDTTVSGNTASGNDAGGVFLYSGAHHILSSTVSGNTAGDDGGGIYLYDGTLLLEDSTVANNQAGDHGGGIYAYDTMDIRHSTISGNSAGNEGGNIYLYLYTGSIDLRNSIVANGNAPSDPDIGTNGGTVNATYSLIETPSPNVVTDATDITLVDPQLGPLQNNGGPTQTMLLALTSPAVNAGDPAYTPPPAADQRGKPRVAGGRTDMGAVELQVGTVTFSQPNYPVSEGGGSAIIGITRTGGGDPITVGFQTSDGTAQQPGDYTATTGSVSFAMDENTTKPGSVPIVDDGAVEPSETINLALTGVPAAFQGVPNTAIITILDNDNAPVVFTIDNIALAEGNAGTTPFTFTVTKNGVTGATTSVQVATSNGTATAPGDYAAVPLTTLTFLPGDTTKQVTVNVVGDTAFEANETFFVNLSNPSGGSVGTPTGQGTIGNDDAMAADLSITKTTPSTSVVTGNNLTYTITVRNNGPQDATSATVTDVVPPNTTLVSATPSQGSCTPGATVVCNLGGITNGNTATITLVVKVTTNTGTVTNSAAVAGAPADPNGANNAATSTPVTITSAAVPALGELGLIALAALLALGAVVKLKE